MLVIGVRSWRKPVCAATQPVRSIEHLALEWFANQQDTGTAKTLTTYLGLLYCLIQDYCGQTRNNLVS